MRRFLPAVVLAGLACGGGSDEARATLVAEAAPAASFTGTVHEVRMLVTPDGEYAYEPDTLTIAVGDRVRWVNVSGGPHNVAFYPDQIPPGARDFLNARIADRMGDLVGPLVFDPNAVYEIAFDAAPEGTYKYVCTPHEMLGMTATFTVTQ
jgi:plastocyanin